MIKEEGVESKKNAVKQKSSLKHLRHKVFKLCSLLYQIHIPGDSTSIIQLSRNLSIFKRLLPKTNISGEYVYCYILESICLFENAVEKHEIMERLDGAGEMIKRIESSNSRSSKLIPLEVLKSYRYYLKAKMLKSEAKLL